MKRPLLLLSLFGCSNANFGGGSGATPKVTAHQQTEAVSPAPEAPPSSSVPKQLTTPEPAPMLETATATATDPGSETATATATATSANPAEEAAFDGRLTAAGAQSGAVQISLVWDGVTDLDLHVIDPAGQHIYYDHRHDSSGGSLDIDANGGDQAETSTPIENVFWSQPPHGTYKIYVNFYGQNESNASSMAFQVRLKVGSQISYFPGTVQYTGNDFDSSGGDQGTALVDTFQY